MSDEPTRLKDMHLDLFKEDTSLCEDATDDTPSITDRCSYLKRLCAALRYFDALSASKLEDAKKKEILVEFMETVYHRFLDDNAHLLKKHSNDLQVIWKEWTERYGFAKCSLSECIKTGRHYRRGRRDKKKEQNDNDAKGALYRFYESVFDRIHNYIAHLYDIGMRVDTESLIKEINGDEKEQDLDGVTVDALFAAERDRVKSRREESKLDLDRFDGESNKFTIQTETAKTQHTFTDALFDTMATVKKLLSENLSLFKEYLDQNQFDSDCVAMDLEDIQDSNIARKLNNEESVNAMKAFLHSVQLRRNAFSTGFIFEYWNENKENFVKPKYNNLKEEIIESGHLNLAEWMEFVELKAKQYMKSERVKGMKACDDEDDNTGKEIKKDDPVTIEHLSVLILYCDFGKLCTEFSATFRRNNVFEEEDAVRQRHEVFAVFGRLLVEVVLRFGVHGYENHGNGPFYCGINTTLNVGQYAIRLMGPTSTSTTRAVALNFAKSEGIIMMLNNDNYVARKQRLFDCSWISNYHEESERLWIAGVHALRIISIAIVESAKNYAKIIHALYVFDSMISGVGFSSGQIEVTSEDNDLISALMNAELGGDLSVFSKFDQYVIDEWHLFLRNKEEILLDLNEIDESFKATSKLIIYNVEREGSGKFDNVLKPEWLSLFPSLRKVKVRVTYSWFAFDLSAFLESVKMIPTTIVVVVEVDDDWAERKRTNLNSDVSAAYAAAGWSIEYDEDYEWKTVTDRIERGGMIIKYVGV